ncbi:MAG: hypothetical protein FWC98_03500, partial [Bacteroidales bacterium]|nr:hypothetical protein [Bacteroidales bacterium]
MLTTILLITLLVLVAVTLWVLLTKKTKDNSEEIKTSMVKFDADLSRIDPLMRDEFERSRKELRDNREELNKSLKDNR